jgi:hypothetical protein
LEVFALDLAFLGFYAGAEIMEGNVFAIHLNPAAEYEAVYLIALVAYQRQCDV